jgi:hypothetical protein
MEGKPGEAAGAVKRALAGMDGAKVSRMMPRSEERGRETKAGMQTLPGPGRALPSSSGDSAAGWNARTLGGDNSTQLSNAATPAFGRVSAPDRFQAHAELPSPNSPWDVQGQKPWVREAALGVTAVKDDAVESATKSLAQEILHSAVRFRSIRAESMSVVLRPDGQTELTLQLTLHQGRIEVEARVQRGDWTTLQAQWAQLQQTLSQQGVRLNALAADASIMTASGGADDRLASPDTPEDRRTPEEQEERSPLRANHERGNGDRPRRTAAVPTKGSWETWA